MPESSKTRERARSGNDLGSDSVSQSGVVLWHAPAGCGDVRAIRALGLGPGMRLVVIAGAVVLLAGCSSPPILLEKTFTIDSHGYAEVDVQLKEGETVSWTWSIADGTPIWFNVHNHDPYEVIHSWQDISSHTGSFTAAADDTYSIYWDSQGPGPQVQVQLTGQGNIATIRP